jgi:hypothetical protein
MKRVLLLVLGICSLLPHTLSASPLAGAAGIESFQGSGGTGSRAVLGTAVLDFGHADALLQGARYQDDVTGSGWSFVAGGSVALAGPLRARLRATRTLGDAAFRAWQLRAGPELRFGTKASAAIYYERDAIGDSARTQGVAAEGLVAVRPRLIARTSGAWARDGGSNRILQAALGGIWRAAPHLDLSADLGCVVSQGAAYETFPIGGPGGGLPLLGGNTGPATNVSGGGVVQHRSPTLLLGARVVFP